MNTTSRVYVSFLGTNDYLECTYVYKDAAPVTNVRFVQEATLKIFCSDWTGDDKIYIFATDDAYRINWLDNGRYGSKGTKEATKPGLKTCIERLQLKPPVECVRIPEGKTEDEVWEIFRKLYNVLPEESYLVFDITHSFRSIPMLAIVAINYAKAMKGLKISGVYYGAFEALGPIPKVREMKPEDRIAPILNLTPLDTLMEWSFAIDRYIATGDARAVSKLTISSAEQILKETKGADQAARTIKTMGKALGAFSQVMATCRGPEVVKVSTWLKEEIANCERLKLEPAFQPLFGRLRAQAARFTGDDVADGVEAAKWCLEHNLVQQAYTILEETIITHIVKSLGRDIRDRTNRELATQALKILRDNLPSDRWQPPASERKDLTEEFCRLLRENAEIRRHMDALTQYRNDLNHAGYSKSPLKPEKFSSKLREILTNIQMVLG